MNDTCFDWPQSAATLLAQARPRENPVQLLLEGVSNHESWLIERHLLPFVGAQGMPHLAFSVRDAHPRSAHLVPLPDGSAFGRNGEGEWRVLSAVSALSEIEFIGHRFAPGHQWQRDFVATVSYPDAPEQHLTPDAVADLWAQVTGRRPDGFERGLLDHAEALSRDLVDKLFTTRGQLGL